MREISPEDPLLKRINLEAVISHMKARNWQEVKHPSGALLVFEGPLDDNKRPVKLILPRDASYSDLYLRLAEAINLLAAVEDKEPFSLARELELDSILARVEIREDEELISFLLNEKRQKERRPTFKNIVAISSATAFLIAVSVLEVFVSRNAVEAKTGLTLETILLAVAQVIGILAFVLSVNSLVRVRLTKEEIDYFHVEKGRTNYSAHRK